MAYINCRVFVYRALRYILFQRLHHFIMFKIVQTIEDNLKVLTAVPQSWEKNGILFWPPGPGKKAYTLRKDASNLPNLNTWTKTKCQIKRDNILTLKEALHQEKILAEFEDTEDEENYRLCKTINRLHPVMKTIAVDDFNHLMTEADPDPEPELMNNNTHNTPNMELTVINSVQDINNVQSLPGDKAEDKALELEVENPVLHSLAIEEKLKYLEKKQEELLKSVAGLHIKFDKLLDLMAANTASSNREPLIESADDTLNDLGLFPIDDTVKLNEVEQRLQDKDFQMLLIKKLSDIGGTDGKKNFNKIVYMVLDAIFERKFLMEISWTGSTKTKGKKKISMLQYKETLQMFFKVIKMADSRYLFLCAFFLFKI
ncbi:hypothetical protein PPYR_05861 [Photinus pyralis]|uniref:DUF4806 domain-containing protein n=1 Tax=Photinus pyralis TaxID=7054 RepID=A0A5N4AW12_PHOPY|nr:hypothetical protein PPYR_05861 [Photinus pyralis]